MNAIDRKTISRANNEFSYKKGGDLPKLKKFQGGGPFGKYSYSYEMSPEEIEEAGYPNSTADGIPENWQQHVNNTNYYTVNKGTGGDVLYNQRTGKYHYGYLNATGAAEPTASPIDAAVMAAAAPVVPLATLVSSYRFLENLKPGKAMAKRAGKPNKQPIKPAQPAQTGKPARPMPQTAGGLRQLPPNANTTPVQYPRGINWQWGGAKPNLPAPMAPGPTASPYLPNFMGYSALVQPANLINTQIEEEKPTLPAQARELLPDIPAIQAKELGTNVLNTGNGAHIVPESRTPAPVAPSHLSFGDAFSYHRASGAKEFEWNGNRYHTRTKEEEDMRLAQQAPTPEKVKAKPVIKEKSKPVIAKREKVDPKKVEDKRTRRKRHTNDRRETRKGARILYKKGPERRKARRDARKQRRKERRENK